MKIRKIKSKTESALTAFFLTVIFLLFLPFFLLYLLFKLLMTPLDYLNYKTSLYQKDFPHKYSWLREPHIDNDAYTAIKKNNIPIEYVKWSEDYDIGGYFFYKDVLLNFSEPFFFDEKEKTFLCLPDADNDDYSDEEELETANGAEQGQQEEENNEDEGCLTVEKVKELIFNEIKEKIPERECNKILFFYSQKTAEKMYKVEAIEAMREREDFIVYRKSELADVLRDFIENN